MTPSIDWASVTDAAAAQLAGAVRRVRAEHPGERVYGAMFHEFYGDGTALYWPCVTVGTEESLASIAARYAERGDPDRDVAAGLRWSGPDLEHTTDPGDVEDRLAERVAAAAAATPSFDDWQQVYDRFLHCFPNAAKQARAELIAQGIVGESFIAIADDEEGELIPLSLTPEQLREHFPEYDEAEQERQRLAALPLADRIAALLPQVLRTVAPGPLTGEYHGLLREIGGPAIPALIEAAGRRDDPSIPALILLAEINDDRPEVVAALTEALTDTDANANVRGWAAAALARLGRSDVLFAHAADLPDVTLARGLAGPFTSFADRGQRRPLDYGPLADAAALRPSLAEALASELKPGRGYLTIQPAEVETARAALDSPWEFIRTHARLVLEDAR